MPTPGTLCSDCPPPEPGLDHVRCLECPRRVSIGPLGPAPSLPQAEHKQPSLIERLRIIAEAKPGDPFPPFLAVSNGWGTALSAMCAEAMAAIPSWRPIETAPVPPFDPKATWSRFNCLLQNDRGEVFEGWAYWVPPPRSRPTKPPIMRWANSAGQVTNAKYWMPMPMPAPRIEP